MRSKTLVCLKQTTFAALAMALVVMGGGTAFAQQKANPVPVIGVVDTDMLLRESLAAKGVQLEREKYANTYQGQIKDQEGKLRAEDQELANQRGIMAQDVYQQRATDFQKKLTEFQTQVKDKQDRLDIAFQQAMQEIGNTIMTISSEVAKGQGINAVFARSQMMIFDPGMDITKNVLDRLNQRLPSVKFQDPATLQLPGGAPGATANAATATAPAAMTPAAAPKPKGK